MIFNDPDLNDDEVRSTDLPSERPDVGDAARPADHAPLNGAAPEASPLRYDLRILNSVRRIVQPTAIHSRKL